MAQVKQKKLETTSASKQKSKIDQVAPIYPSQMASLKIMIMNAAGGTDCSDKPTERRKQAIYEVVTKIDAALVLFQEFNWIGIHGKAWNGFNWSDNLQYTGNKDASILFNVNEVERRDIRQSDLDGTLQELQRKGDIQIGFTPIPRMCVKIIKTKGVPIVEFICVSWHGRHKAKLETLKEEFDSLLKYILKLAEKYLLPVLIAGDFNVKIKDIEKYVPSTLLLHRYAASKRRGDENIIDFFLTSKTLLLSKVTAITLTSETTVKGVLSLLDHDPVVASLTHNPVVVSSMTTKPKIQRQILYKK